MAVVLLLHLAMLAYLIHAQGIAVDKEAAKYIGAAQDLLAGDAQRLLHRYPGYGMYVLFLVPFVWIGDPRLAIAVQVLLGLFAARSLHRLVLRLTASTMLARIAMAALLLSYVVQSWTVSLYTEAFITPLALMLVEHATRPAEHRRHGWIMLLMPLVLFARPVGILFVAPVAAHLVADRWPGSRRWVPAAAVAVLLALLFMPMDRDTVIGPIVRGEVIYGFPRWPDAEAALHIRSIAGAQGELLATHPPLIVLELAWQKAIGFFVLTRSFFSPLHNALLLLHYPVYLLALLGMVVPDRPVQHIARQVLLLHVAVFALTYNEWHGRFMAPVWPLLLAMATVGALRMRALLER